ncbi:D-alanyl-D-alanine carboxypeptidase [Brevibacillus laterosporus]|nr:D-alanyl-D-alanine carboxypeptidase family protein [Brevibacillus laterosporus]RAP26129.1 D-alanyl-D-alanine carboxypeptidase [Brevibacillus laterosporus]
MKKWMKTFLAISFSLITFGVQPSYAAQPPVLPLEEVQGEGAILIDGSSGTVLFEKNPQQYLFPASITKIATAIYAIENGNVNDMATVSNKARTVEGSRVYLAEGEQVSMRNLLFGLILNSGNDAAIVIAEHMAGSTEAFADKVNAYLKEKVGVKNTHFTNPHGLHDENHYTTAADMAKIAQYAMKNPFLREIAGTKRYNWHQKEWETVLVNHNKMLTTYEGTTGLKNGFTDQARNTLVVTAKRGDTELIAVTMKAPSNVFSYQDVHKMLDFGFAHYETKKIVNAGQYMVYQPKTDTEKAANFFADKDLFITVPKKTTYEQRLLSTGDLVLTLSNGEERKLHLQPEVLPMVAPSSEEGIQVTHNPIALYGIVVFWSLLNLFFILFFIRLLRAKRRTNIVLRKRANME